MPEAAIEKREASLEDIERIVEEGSPKMYAILDACDEPSVPVIARNLEDKACCLFQGKALEQNWNVAPYLVEVTVVALECIKEELWGKPFGFFFTAPDTTLEDLWRHFRHFTLVKLPDDKTVYFRFYDPRVLGTYLESCTKEEVREFFGQVSTIWVNDSNHLLSIGICDESLPSSNTAIAAETRLT